MLVGAHHRPIDVVLLPIDLSTHIRLPLQLGQDACPKSTALPPIEARGDRLPWPVALGQVAPRGPGLVDPEHAVDDAPMVVERTASSSRGARWQKRREVCPLFIGQFVTSHARYSTAFGEQTLATSNRVPPSIPVQKTRFQVSAETAKSFASQLLRTEFNLNPLTQPSEVTDTTTPRVESSWAFLMFFDLFFVVRIP
jgi:hypothetical protein